VAFEIENKVRAALGVALLEGAQKPAGKAAKGAKVEDKSAKVDDKTAKADEEKA
jgi:hypothetical protein